MRWRLSDVEPGDVFTREVSLADPLLYKVVGVITDPVVVLRPLFERDGEDTEYHVIGSADFAEFRKVEARGPED